ncbi:SAC3/GANP/Nin1/mts3/eIF-3 p25 family-domain-containing protein [Hypoxylon sp. NC1633]|nr:SAC3/GANP/Nin1/mts3/eIF-3 p25 family-domain-containing protein [Hypoxylon sp. NC1633]
MLNTERQGGWGFGDPPKPPTGNPFSQTSQPSNPFAQRPANPFLQKPLNGSTPTPNPFLANSAPNPFAATTSSQTSFTSISNSSSQPNPFLTPIGAQASKLSNATSNSNSSIPAPFANQQSVSTNGNKAPAVPSANGKGKNADIVQPPRPKLPQNALHSTTVGSEATNSRVNGKRRNEDGLQRKNKFSRTSLDQQVGSVRAPIRDNQHSTLPRDGNPANPRVDGHRDDFANKIIAQLAKDNIKPPRWPADPGSLASRQVIERFRETYKAYRERARKSLMRADLIDDPDKKRRLDEALVFKGICEDMCPEWEQITRIVEHDIRGPEKDVDKNGDFVAMPNLMVKRLARSAAGQDAPLPMDVRSVSALRHTLDYLIDDLIPSDDQLAQRHGFLWDRTRAIRIDFSFQKYAMTPGEIKDQIYCLETIARFHVTALHLLSQDSVAQPDFSEQQEIEQLGKTLISLIEVYDDCAQQGIKCENEPEFRGYYILYNAHNSGLMEKISDWGRRYGPGIQCAVSIVECFENIRTMHGPLYPDTLSQMPLDAITIFFDIIAQPTVSYTMACFAEIHFNTVRKAILKLVRKSFSRPRSGPRDLTPAILKQSLRTDTEEEAVDFFKKHGFQFNNDDSHVILSPGPDYTNARIRHPFSGDIVERKRSGRPLPMVIRETVFEATDEQLPTTDDSISSEEESLFVEDSHDEHAVQEGRHSEEERSESTPLSSPDAIKNPRRHPPLRGNRVVAKGKIPFEQSPISSPTSLAFGITSNSAEQSPVPVITQPYGDVKTQTTQSPSPTPSPSPAFIPTKRLPTSNTDPNEAIGDQATSSVPPSIKITSSENSREAIQEKANTGDPETADTQTHPPATKKVQFAGDVLIKTATPSSNNDSTPSVSSILKKSENKGLAASSITTNTSVFPPSLSKPLDTSNKDEPQQPSSSITSTIPGPSATSTTPSTSPCPSLSSATLDLSDQDKTKARLPSDLFAMPESIYKAPGTSEPTTSAAQPAIATPIASSSANVPGPGQPVFATSQPSMTLQQQTTEPIMKVTPSVHATEDNNSLSKETSVANTGPMVSSPRNGPVSMSAPPSTVQSDPMGDFTKWFVCADRGLMEEQLQAFAVEHVLKEIWDGFQTLEEERIRKEEDEKSWAEARKFRDYSLRVKFFYRWHNGFRKRSVIKRMKMEREKARQWRLPENRAKREREAKEEQERIVQEAENSMLKRSRSNVDEAAKLRSSTRASFGSSVQRVGIPSTHSSPESRAKGVEDMLLATGIFKGMKDERAAARYAAMESDDDIDKQMEKKMHLRSENHRRVKRGLRPLKALPEPTKTYKEGPKTAKVRALYCGAGRDTMSMSAESLRNSTFSSSYRSSLGYNNSKVSKPRTRATDPYWRLKANGLVRMPNGEYLHESIALPMLQGGKRFPGFGDYGLPPAEPAIPNESPLLLPNGYSSPLIRADETGPPQGSSSPLGVGSQKRKRQADDADPISNGNDVATTRKRARSRDRDDHSMADSDKHLADIASLLDRVNSVVKSTSKQKAS